MEFLFWDRNGTPLSDPVSPLNWCRGAIEGSIRTTKDGQLRTINFAGTKAGSQVNCAQVLSINPSQKPWIISTGKSYFAPAIDSWSDGVNGFRLVSFRSAAVDKTSTPFGSTIFIPSLEASACNFQPASPSFTMAFCLQPILEELSRAITLIFSAVLRSKTACPQLSKVIQARALMHSSAILLRFHPS